MERLRRPDWNSRWYIRPPALLIMIKEKTPLVLEGILVAVRFNEQTDGAYVHGEYGAGTDSVAGEVRGGKRY